MAAICSMLPGFTDPIQPCEYPCEECLDEEECLESDIEETFVDMPSETYTENTKVLPQPTKEFTKPLTVECDSNSWDSDQSYGLSTVVDLETCVPENGSTSTIQAGVQSTPSENSKQDNMYVLLDYLDPHLRPATPDYSNPESVAVYEEHKQLAQEYWKVQTELVLINQKKNQQLAAEAEDQQRKRRIKALQEEKESLRLARDLLVQQKERSITDNSHRASSEGWVIVPRKEEN